MTAVVRTLGVEDWEMFREVRLRSLADAPDAFGALAADAAVQPETVWRSRVGGPGPTMVVLEDDRPVAVGGVFAPPGESRAMLWGMWTAPEARGRGHAERILRALVEWCRGRGLDVCLHVTEGNDAARRLYERHGFVGTGEWTPLREGSPLQVETLRLP